jgi:hypothetical protein
MGDENGGSVTLVLSGSFVGVLTHLNADAALATLPENTRL